MFLTFINRKAELNFLDERFKRKGFELIILYGRRRVGKTELIKEFIKGKQHLYFLSDKRGTESNFSRFKKKIAEFLDEPSIESNEPEQIFAYLAGKIKERMIVIIDEFSYLVEKDSAIPSIFQLIVDEQLKNSNIMIILCGSSISMMEEGTLSQKSPLYGRKTGHYKIAPLSFNNSGKFFPENSLIKNLEFWSILDGIPFYLEKFSDKLTTLENVKAELLRREGTLFEEVEFILKEELREPDVYKAILEAIGEGKTKTSDIANKSGIKVQDIDKYLKVLIRLGIIKKDMPITEKAKSKKTIYTFKDNLFHFWFSFCEPYRSELGIGELKNVIKKLDHDFNSFIGKKFESLCRTQISLFEDDGFTKVGYWWSRKGDEIDIVALNDDKKEILFAECKWSDKKVDMDLFNSLKEKSRLVDWNADRRIEKFALFSKSGFTSRMIEAAKKENIRLFDLKEIEKLLI